MRFHDHAGRQLLMRATSAAVTTFYICVGIGTAGARNPQATGMNSPVACPLDVMKPVAELDAFRGNTSAHVPDIMNMLATRILTLARERCPGAQVIQRQTGGAVLVPTIVEWQQMRTDDPIGALVTRHNSIVIRLQLTGTGEPARARTVTFRNRSRLTLNQPAERLLNADFNKTVRLLLSSKTP